MKYLLTLGIGASAGAALGYFTAPKSGKKSREALANKMDATKKSLEEAAMSKLEEAKSLLNKTAKKQTDNGKAIADKAEKMVKV